VGLNRLTNSILLCRKLQRALFIASPCCSPLTDLSDVTYLTNFMCAPVSAQVWPCRWRRLNLMLERVRAKAKPSGTGNGEDHEHVRMAVFNFQYFAHFFVKWR
jgi:hypothetical protein